MDIKNKIKTLLPKSVVEIINNNNLRKEIEFHKSKVNEGLRDLNLTGSHKPDGYNSLVKLYCMTNGKYTEDLNSEIIKDINPRPQPTKLSGVLGQYDQNEFLKLNNTLNEDGYVHFDQKLDKDLCKRLYDFAINTKAKIPPLYNEKIKYDSENPLAEIYRFDRNDLMNNQDIQKLAMDPVIVNIARNYLGGEPIFEFPSMWWSTTFLKEASLEAAQLYHFDLDRVKWLKVFIYLTDVNEDNGPHCYIKHSHKVNNKPQHLLDRGYVRIPDEDVHPHYPLSDVKVIQGEIGSIFMGDTKCWHKGTPLKKGHRLVLELEYCTSLFGAENAVLELSNYTDSFREYCESNTQFSKNIKFVN